jgi:hypothetical protein
MTAGEFDLRTAIINGKGGSLVHEESLAFRLGYLASAVEGFLFGEGNKAELRRVLLGVFEDEWREKFLRREEANRANRKAVGR